MDTLMFLRLVACALAQSPESREVYAFGSTAQQLHTFVSDWVNDFSYSTPVMDFNCNSSDLDLVITVSPRIYEAWNRELNEHLDCVADCNAPSADAYDGCKWFRFNLALQLLGCGTYKNCSPLFGWLSTLDEIKELDLHLMPQDWRKRTAELQDDLPHKDPLFVSNIAQDAVELTEFDTADFVAWQDKFLQNLTRLQRVRQSIGRAAVLNSMISTGLAEPA